MACRRTLPTLRLTAYVWASPARRSPMAAPLELNINGRRQSVDVDPSRSLLAVLRDDLDLTGSKYGCGEGQCGACTVLLDGRPVRSCLTAVGTVGTRPVVTIEGLEREGKLHAVQAAFMSETALQ